jgi:hypothetical protein
MIHVVKIVYLQNQFLSNLQFSEKKLSYTSLSIFKQMYNLSSHHFRLISIGKIYFEFGTFEFKIS